MLSDAMRPCCNSSRLPASTRAGCTRGEKGPILKLPFIFPSQTAKSVIAVALEVSDCFFGGFAQILSLCVGRVLIGVG